MEVKVKCVKVVGTVKCNLSLLFPFAAIVEVWDEDGFLGTEWGKKLNRDDLMG